MILKLQEGLKLLTSYLDGSAAASMTAVLDRETLNMEEGETTVTGTPSRKKRCQGLTCLSHTKGTPLVHVCMLCSASMTAVLDRETLNMKGTPPSQVHGAGSNTAQD